MKTKSIIYTDHQESDQHFSLNKQRNIFVSDFSIEFSPKKTNRSVSPRKQWIKTATESHTFVLKTANLLQLQNQNALQKIFKRGVYAVKVCLRLMKLLQLRHEQPLPSPRKAQNKEETLRERVLNGIVLKWCKCICKKAISSIKAPVYDYLQNSNDKVKTDISKMQLINAIKFLMESLAYYTHSHYIHYDLKGFLSSQLYSDYKLYFTHFVSERTKYKVAILDELEDKAAALIAMEIILYNLSEAIIQEQLICNFSKIIFISILQLLFKQHFDDMMTNISKQDSIYGEICFVNNCLRLNFKQGTTDSLNLIDGVLRDFELVSLLEFNKTQMNKIQQYFSITIKHLEQQIQ